MRASAMALALVVIVTVAAASVALAQLPTAEPASGVQVIFPAGTVVHVTNFSALARFTVHAPGAQFVGAFHADHWMWIMAWTNGTPMPLCPIAMGYVGSPMNTTYNETLKPETYTLSEVCGGLGNFTVTQTIELVYGSSTGGNTGGGTPSGVGSSGGPGATGLGALSSPAVLVILLVAAAGCVAILLRLPRWRRSREEPPGPPPGG